MVKGDRGPDFRNTFVAASEPIGWQTQELIGPRGSRFLSAWSTLRSRRLARIHAVDSGPDVLQRQESDRTVIANIGLSSKIRFREAFLFNPTALSQRSSSVRDIRISFLIRWWNWVLASFIRLSRKRKQLSSPMIGYRRGEQRIRSRQVFLLSPIVLSNLFAVAGYITVPRSGMFCLSPAASVSV